MSYFISICILAITALPAFATLSNEAVFDWVEYKFPELFPKSIRVKEPRIIYNNAYIDLRTWSGHWGTRYLGISDENEILGLGDYTDGVVLSFGDIDDWQNQIIADYSDPNTPIIVWNYTSGDFMNAPDVDYTKPSSETQGIRKHLNYQEMAYLDDGGFNMIPHDLAIFDYDGDGILDAVTGNSHYINSFSGKYPLRQNIRFLKGNSDGTLERDYSFDLGLGPEHGIIRLINDFNLDGFPDVFIVSHGMDDGGETEGDYPISIMSDGRGGYSNVHYTEIQPAWYHAGTSVDIDYDGDLDVYMSGTNSFGEPQEVLLENINGTLVPTEMPTAYKTNIDPGPAKFNDLDGDGFFEFIAAADDFPYGFMPQNIGFVQDSTGVRYDIPPVEGWSDPQDLDFYDIDGDGIKEIFLCRSGSPPNAYTGVFIQIMKYTPGVGLEEYQSIITDPSILSDEDYFYYLRIKVTDSDGDGNVEIIPNEGNLDDHVLGWEFINGTFEKARIIKITQ